MQDFISSTSMRLLVFALALPCGNCVRDMQRLSNAVRTTLDGRHHLAQELDDFTAQHADDEYSTRVLAQTLLAFRPGVLRQATHTRPPNNLGLANSRSRMSPLMTEFNNPFIAALSSLLPGDTGGRKEELVQQDPLDAIKWNRTKSRGISTEKMTGLIDEGLREREWFVSGQGLPELFSERFTFSDPDVSLDGFEPYCRQVRRLFDQQTARCEVVCCAATDSNTITIVWRNSGKVNLGPGFELKPYVVTTLLRTDPEDGLIISQEDAFKINGAELLLYQIPALRSLLSASAPDVEELRQRYDPRTCDLIS